MIRQCSAGPAVEISLSLVGISFSSWMMEAALSPKLDSHSSAASAYLELDDCSRQTLGVIQQLRWPNFTQFCPPTPSSGQKWTFFILYTLCYLTHRGLSPDPNPSLLVHVVIEWPLNRGNQDLISMLIPKPPYGWSGRIISVSLFCFYFSLSLYSIVEVFDSK